MKLPLWDKASAEFCFAKSRELLTKPSAWASYMDMDFDAHILDNAATKQNLVKSTEFLENGNRKSSANCEAVTDGMDGKLNMRHQNGKIFNLENSNFDFPREVKRVSTSYVERYFEQPKYFDDEPILGCPGGEKMYFGEEKLDKYDKINNLEQPNRSAYYSNVPEQSSSLGGRSNQTLQSKSSNCEPQLKDNIAHFEARADENFDILKEKTANFESPRSKPNKFEVVRDKATNLDLGTRPKIPVTFSESTKMNITEFTKKIDLSKSRAAKVSFVPRNPNQDVKSGVYGSSDSIKANMKTGGSDSPRGNMDAMRINIQSFRKIEQNQNGHEGFPFVISNNPLFIAEPEKKESPIYSSSESLRVNFQRLRRKSDAEASQVELNSKLLAEKYQREVSGLETVKSYLDSKKGQGLNLGLGKLTQNMIQLGKNIAQNSRNLETASSKSLVSNIRNLDLSVPSQTPPLRSLNIPIQKPKHLDLNIPLQSQSPINTKLSLMQKVNQPPTSPTLHQHILEPPKLYQNDPARKELPKLDVLVPEKLSGAANVYRHRTSSLSENRKPPMKNVRRSFHPKNDSSEDSDSVSHSETDIRSQLRYKRKHKRVPHSLRLNFRNKPPFLHPDSAKGFSAIELCGKSPPPSTSFLNSLSPPFSSRNNLLSWPESAPSSSLTFTSNSDLDSDTSSEYPEFTSDVLTFPPSPAP